MERLASSDAAVGWQACILTAANDGPEGEYALRLSAGIFDPSKPEAVAVHQRKLGATRATEFYAMAGERYVEYQLGSFALSESEWTEASRLFDIVLSAEDLLDPVAAAKAVGVAEVDPVPLTDAQGRVFYHYEALPPTRWESREAEEPAPAGALFDYPYGISVVYAVDLWTAQEGTTERIRVRTQDLMTRWMELRFTDEAVGSDGYPQLPDCPEAIPDSAMGDWVGFELWQQKLTVPLNVAVDPAGRPYDVVPFQAVQGIRWERLGTIHTADGRIIVMDGNQLEVDMAYFYDEGAPVVDFGEPTDLDAAVVYEVFDEEREDVLGVRLTRPGSNVHRWQALEFAYGTDGGVGGFTTGVVMAEAQRRGNASLSEKLAAKTAALDSMVVVDLDEVDGFDTAYFFNGWGDGAFPMARGFDVSGEVVSLFIFDTRYPWRLAIPDGIPPPDVAAREAEFIECMEGIREIKPDGSCPADIQR